MRYFSNSLTKTELCKSEISVEVQVYLYCPKVHLLQVIGPFNNDACLHSIPQQHFQVF
jgi:hypothetical protein